MRKTNSYQLTKMASIRFCLGQSLNREWNDLNYNILSTKPPGVTRTARFIIVIYMHSQLHYHR